MAIYHFSAQVISRAKGQSAVASASYRSGEKLYDERSEESKYYKREVKPETHILAPSHAPSWVQDREKLWNEVEKIEKQKNSQLAREINMALPKELSNEQQTELIKNYVQEQFVNKGMVADIAIHRDDQNNPHAHVMLTMRAFKENGEWANKRKKEYEYDKEGNKVLDKKGQPKFKTVHLTDWNNKENIQVWREQWEHHVNKALEKENIQERVSHKSHADRGLETLPTIHLGYKASAMEKKGIETDRGNINREVKQHNAIVYDLQKYREEKKQIEARLKEQQKEQQKQKAIAFTPSEQQTLNEIETMTQRRFNEKPNLDNIKKLKGILNQFDDSTNNERTNLTNKLHNINTLCDKEAYVTKLEKVLEEKEQALANTGLFKLKEKDELRKDINRLTKVLNIERENLSTLIKDNGISSREAIPVETKEIKKDILKSFTALEETQKDSDNLRKQFIEGQKILKDYEIRKAIDLYPELQGKEIEYKTALQVNKYHEHISKISDISSIIENDKAKMSDLTNDISSFDKRVETLVLAEQKLQEADELLVKIKAIQDNPYLHGKSLHDPTGKEEYEKLVASRKAITKELVEMNYGSRNGILADRELVDEQKPKHEQNMKQLEELKEKTKALTNIQRDIQRAEKQQEHTITR